MKKNREHLEEDSPDLLIKKLEYITEEESVTESQNQNSIYLSNSSWSENTKWKNFGVKKVKNGEIVDIIAGRLYVLETNSEDIGKKSIENKDSILKTKSLVKKWKALSKRIQPLNDKFDSDYTVWEIIGNGNFGQVFKCKWKFDNFKEEFCAVK